jgi:hypothetical protein
MYRSMARLIRMVPCKRNIEYPRPRFICHIGQPTRATQARVVNQNIDTAGFHFRKVHQRLHLGLVSHIAKLRAHLARIRKPSQCLSSLTQTPFVDVTDNNRRCSLLDRALCGREPNTGTGSSCDQH